MTLFNLIMYTAILNTITAIALTYVLVAQTRRERREKRFREMQRRMKADEK